MKWLKQDWQAQSSSQEAEKDPAGSFRHKHLPQAMATYPIATAQPFHSRVSSQVSSGHFQAGL